MTSAESQRERRITDKTLRKSIERLKRALERELAELPELGSLDRRQIAALAGLAPWTRQSGQWRGTSMIGGGRTSVRCALFMAAMVAGNTAPHFKAFKAKLIAAGKPPKVAIIAIAQKLLTILNAIIRDNTSWTPKTA